MPDTAETCLAIKAHFNARRFAMKTQSKLDRSLEAFVRVNITGFHTGDDEKARTEASKAAMKHIGRCRDGEYLPYGDMIRKSDESRAVWDAERKGHEKAITKLVPSLPGFSFVEECNGFGAMGFGLIVGECGDLTNYATVSRVWRRLGLAPFQGHAGSTWKRQTWRPRALSADEWVENPFSGERYSTVFNIGDSMLKKQIEGAEKSGTEFGRPRGPYGEVYVARREYTKINRPDWTKSHALADARRVMVKALLRDLWAAWHRETKFAMKPMMVLSPGQLSEHPAPLV